MQNYRILQIPGRLAVAASPIKYWAIIFIIFTNTVVFAQDSPSYKIVRYEEDYSYLAEPSKHADLYDPIKYIPLGKDSKTYLSLGGKVRERYEDFYKNPIFGITRLKEDDYLLNRVLLHVDLHIAQYLRAFVQYINAVNLAVEI